MWQEFVHCRLALVLAEETIAKAWQQSIERCFLSPQPQAIEYDSAHGRCIEVQNVVLSVRSPIREPRIPKGFLFEKDLTEYRKGVLHGPKTPGSLHQRLFAWRRSSKGTLNQLEAVIDTLKRDATSRRAVVGIWDPDYDGSTERPMSPCLIQFSVRADGVRASAFVRSSDAWTGAVQDLVVFSDLQYQVADALGQAVGEYTHHAGSYHIYKMDLPRAAQLARRG